MTTQEPLSISEPPLAQALAAIQVFEGLRPEQIEWFAANSQDRHYNDGDVLIRPGDPANELIVILSGVIEGYREQQGQDPFVYTARAGLVTGMLPFSRLTNYNVRTKAVGPTRIAAFPARLFDEMMSRIPELTPRLVSVLADRIREVTKGDVQREKLAALGKLSAGLAHELNNPASAVRRGVGALREAFQRYREATQGLCAARLDPEHLKQLAKWEVELTAKPAAPADQLERSDREDALQTWLAGRNVSEPWELAAALADSGADPDELQRLTESLPDSGLPPALRRAAAVIEFENTLRDIEHSSQRISDLVKAVKVYTYMDQSGEKDVDIHDGIESTLTMLHHRMKNGITVRREFDRSLPRVCVRAGELNQVWANLIDNAIDAMQERGELTVQTSAVQGRLRVRVIDNGSGIPKSLQPRVFEPFFTTKEVGQGTGLGLDIAHRIVVRHHGDIRFESEPGRTMFEVFLPMPTKEEKS
jgi:signal transduction histidine kinase